MALPQAIVDSLKEAEGSLRNALAFAARSEKSIVCMSIARILQELNSIQTYDEIITKAEEKGEDNPFGNIF